MKVAQSCGIVGGIEAIAREWARLDVEREEARKRVDEANRNYEVVVARQERAASLLMERVGNNVPMKVFEFDGDVVVVEHKQGIRRLRIERDAR